MANQRITIAKIGGEAADVALRRLRIWAEARTTDDPNEWGSHQWPAGVRSLTDAFADGLRVHGYSVPVLFFVESWDPWSMGDLFPRWLTPPDGPGPVIIHGNRFQVYAYALPDGGHLAGHLRAAPRQQFAEYTWFIRRLREAGPAWEEMPSPAVIIVLREVFGGLVTDEEVADSLASVPHWLSKMGWQHPEIPQ